MSVRKAKSDGILDGARILLVEDDPLLLMELEAVLQDAGARIVGSCRSVKEALNAAARTDISAAVLDFRLGSETALPIADYLAVEGVPFLFYTGQLGGDLRAARWGVSRLLYKPATPEAIVAAVRSLLAEPSAVGAGAASRPVPLER